MRGLSTESADPLVGARATSTALARSRQTRSSSVPSRGSLLEPLGTPGRRLDARSPGTPPPPAARPRPAPSVSQFSSLPLSASILPFSVSSLPVTCARVRGSGLVSAVSLRPRPSPSPALCFPVEYFLGCRASLSPHLPSPRLLPAWVRPPAVSPPLPPRRTSAPRCWGTHLPRSPGPLPSPAQIPGSPGGRRPRRHPRQLPAGVWGSGGRALLF